MNMLKSIFGDRFVVIDEETLFDEPCYTLVYKNGGNVRLFGLFYSKEHANEYSMKLLATKNIITEIVKIEDIRRENDSG